MDRVFQPSADALAPWASPFSLARIALVIAVEAQTLTLFWDMMLDQSAFGRTLVMLIAAVLLFGAKQAWTMIARAERQARPGTANIRRISLRGQRITWLVVCGCCTMVVSTRPDIRALFLILGNGAWVALAYFVSCDVRPPVFRRAMVPLAATS